MTPAPHGMATGARAELLNFRFWQKADGSLMGLVATGFKKFRLLERTPRRERGLRAARGVQSSLVEAGKLARAKSSNNNTPTPFGRGG
jgi:hypothetical protein